MIKNWTLHRFKSALEKTTLEMAPLTVFAGANSSGKSTLIQSILLTTQTLQNPVYSRSIILNGHIVRLGAYTDVVSNNHTTESIMVGFELSDLAEIPAQVNAQGFTRTLLAPSWRRLRDALEEIHCHYAFSAGNTTGEVDLLQLQPQLEECSIRVLYRVDEKLTEEEVLVRRSSKSLEERLNTLQLSKKYSQKAEIATLEYEVLKPATTKRLRRVYVSNATAKLVGASLHHFLPLRLSIVFDAIEDQSRQIAEAFTTPEEYSFVEVEIGPEYKDSLNDSFKKIVISTIYETVPPQISPSKTQTKRFEAAMTRLSTDFSPENIQACYRVLLPSVRRVLRQRFAERFEDLKNAARGSRRPEYTIENISLPQRAEIGAELTRQFFTRMVKYLGPLRDEPKPMYPLAGSNDPRDVGFKGEHTAAVLEVHRNTKVQYVPSNQFGVAISIPEHTSATLLTAVLDWLEYMGVASRVKTLDQGKLGHELKVSTSEGEELHDLTHVGVGVSQVLPILVLSLLAEPGSTLVFEQPELHLHPRVQTRLADFFVSLTMLKKQCIVETHSEYLINRLRYRVAIAEDDQMAERVIIYSVEKQDGYSRYQPIRINKFGVIENWPKGFFDESEDIAASILKATMMKKKGIQMQNE